MKLFQPLPAAVPHDNGAIRLPRVALFAVGLWAAVLTTACRGGELDGVEAVYNSVGDLTARGKPRICILDTELPDVVRQDVKKKGIDQYKNRLLAKDLARLSGVPCLLLHYTQISRDDFTNPDLKALAITARRGAINAKYDEELFALIRQIKIPTIGFCGGHQLIAQAYGGKFETMRKLKPGEADPRPQYHPGVFKEWGFQKISIVRRDPLFDGLGGAIAIREFHAFEVTKLTDDFDILASSDECRVEAVRHKQKPLYGTQFHPERYDQEHRDGETLLVNFLRMAGLPAAR